MELHSCELIYSLLKLSLLHEGNLKTNGSFKEVKLILRQAYIKFSLSKFFSWERGTR